MTRRGTTPSEQTGDTTRTRPTRRRHRRYGTLLAILIATYLLAAFLPARWSVWISDAQILLFTAAGLLALRNSPLRRRRHYRSLTPAALIVSLVLMVIAEHLGGSIGRGAAAAWAGLILLLAVMLIVRQILLMPTVTAQSIYGAISAYLIIGLMFASLFAAMYWLQGQQFFAGHQPGTISNFQYFSFTTLTTLGYGDFTPYQDPGQAVAMIEAMTGQIFLVTLVAKLVSAFRPAPRDAAGDFDDE
ncbi:MAG: potassium channel family protein [Streptosporangiaceae bacterium]